MWRPSLTLNNSHRRKKDWRFHTKIHGVICILSAATTNYATISSILSTHDQYTNAFVGPYKKNKYRGVISGEREDQATGLPRPIHLVRHVTLRMRRTVVKSEPEHVAIK